MFVNADFDRPALVTPDEHRWTPSPQRGVSRVMLDRVGAEQARATSLVRYDRASDFPSHAHPGGEEILVLEGTFSDETGDYPAGCYLRNPPGSAHRPRSVEGALILVKLRQMSPDDATIVRVNTQDPANWTQRDGRSVCALHRYGDETVDLLEITAGAALLPRHVDGAEIFVLQGGLRWGDRTLPPQSWLRLPGGEYADLRAGDEGLVAYLKTGAIAPIVSTAGERDVPANPADKEYPT